MTWALLSLSVIWGLLLSAKLLNRRTAPGWALDLHRFLGGSALVMLALHLGGLVADNWVHFGWVEILVPMTATYRPGAVAWGVASMYLLVAVEVTSLMRQRLPRTLWRATHLLSFPLFAATTFHGLRSGKDAHLRAYEIAVATVVAAVIVLLLVRMLSRRGQTTDRTSKRANPGSALTSASASM
jgi:predicted ferric reductase